MIKSIKLINFQSHKNTTLEFDNGVNVIIGSSDSGKTAIIRGLRWIIDNRPGGDSFRSWWGGDTSVIIETTNHIIERKRTKKGNHYILDGVEFTAFGTNIPKEVQKALNMDEVNLQQQFDRHYLISDTAGGVSSHFNELANLTKIDQGIQKTSKTIKTLTKEYQYKSETITEKKEKLKEYSNLKEIEKAVSSLEAKVEKVCVYEKKEDNLVDLIEDIEDVTEDINTNKIPEGLENELTKILELYGNKNKKEINLIELKQLSLQIYNIKQDQIQYTGITKAENEVNKYMESYQILNKHKAQLTELTNLCDSIADIQIGSERLVDEIDKISKVYKKNFPKICPLCNTKLK